MRIFALNRTFGFAAGIENSFIQYVRVFRRLGHEVTVFCEEEALIPRDLKDLSRHRVPGLCIVKHLEDSPEALVEFQNLVKVSHPDLIFLNHTEHPLMTEWVASLNGTRVIRRLALHGPYCLNGWKVFPRTGKACSLPFGWRCLVHTYWSHCDARRPGRLLRHFEYVRRNFNATRRLDGLVAPSYHVKEILKYNGVPTEKIFYIPPHHDVADQAGEDSNYILFVGRISRSKGLDFLLHALKKAETTMKLIVVGDGAEKERSEALVRQLGLIDRVEFKGFLPPAEVQHYQRHCSFLVFPSIWEEPGGRVPIETMAWSKPVVAFAGGNVTEVVRDGVNGFVVPRKDIEALAARITLLSNDGKLRKGMGEEGREIAQREWGEALFEARIGSMLDAVLAPAAGSPTAAHTEEEEEEIHSA